MRVRFGEWTFDSDRRELLRGEEVVHLSPKAFDLLGLLIAERPRALSKAQIYEAIWPDTFVSESTLTSVMAEIRRVLGDTAREAAFVRTKHRFGYSFCGTVSEVEAAAPPAPRGPLAACRLILDDRELALSEGENVLGRTREADLWIDDPSVSRRHARILVSGDSVHLEDLGSKNGTFLHDVRLEEPAPLADDDLFCLGSVWIRFRRVVDDASTRTSDVPPQPKPASGPAEPSTRPTD